MPYDARLINVDTGKINALEGYLEAKAESLLAGGFYGTPEDPQSASPFLTQYLPKPQEQFTQREIAKAAWERENEVGSFIAKAQNGFNYNNEVDPQDPNFDIIDYINDEVDNSDYAPYAENFLQFKNRRNADLYKKHLDREFRNTEILQNSGWSGVAWGVGASLLSPVNLIPIGGSAYKAYKAGQFVKGVALTAGAGAVSMTGSEILLQGSQESRTLGESVMNIGAGTLLAGALGGASATLSKKQFSQLAKKVEKDIQSDVAEVKINPQTQNVELNTDIVKPLSKQELEFLDKYYNRNNQVKDFSLLEKNKNDALIKLQEFEANQNTLYEQRLRESGYPLDVITGYENRIKEVEANRAIERQQINRGKTGKRLRLFDEETNQIINDLKDELKAIKDLNEPTKPSEIFKNLNKEKNKLKKEYEKAQKELTDALALQQKESQIIAEQPQQIIQNQNILTEIDSAGSASVKQFDPIRKQYDEIYTPEIIARGETPLPFKDYLKQQTALVPTITQDVAKLLKVDKLTKKINLINNLNPILRLTQTEYAVKPREFAQKLMKTGLYTNKNLEGIANYQSAEINKKATLANYVHNYRPAEDVAYREFKQRIKKEGAKPADSAIKNDIEFFSSLSRAMRNGDVSPIPEINKLAQTARQQISKLSQEAVNVGILDENILKTAPKTAISYFPRLWNKLKVIARENELRQLLFTKIKNVLLPQIKEVELAKEAELNAKILDLQTRKLELESKIEKTKLPAKDLEAIKTEIGLLDRKIETAKNKYTEKQIEIRSKFEEIGDENDYINEVVSDIVAKLKGEDRLGLVNDTDIKVDKRGPLKERTLNFVMDNELEPWLENDARKVMAYYANTLATDIEIARAFDGDLTLSNAVEEISREYDEAISKTTTEDEAIKINKEKRTAINDLTSVAKIMRGIYARPDNPDSMIVRGGRIARQYNYITKMGQVVMSSISDISRPISKHGLATWAKTLPNLITNLKGIKLNIKDAKLAGNISDTVMPERMASFSSLNDTFASNNSTFERYVENISALMSKINMMPVWNDGMKGFSSVMTQQRMIDNILNYEKADKRNITYLAQIGIGKDRINDLVKEIKKHSYKEGNLWVANTEKWENKEIARIYYNALNTDVDSTIATMGAGDLPLWGNTEVGKVILQFKSFAFASTQQTLLAGLQQKDLAVLNGVISATSLGMLSYYLKRKMAGKEPSDNPAVWLSEGLDRSGYLAILSEYSHIADKAGLGVSSLTGIEQSSRYASRNAAASLLGPSIALVDDGFTTARALSSGEISPSDARAIRRMIFLNNHWLLTGAMDRLQESLVNTE